MCGFRATTFRSCRHPPMRLRLPMWLTVHRRADTTADHAGLARISDTIDKSEWCGSNSLVRPQVRGACGRRSSRHGREGARAGPTPPISRLTDAGDGPPAEGVRVAVTPLHGAAGRPGIAKALMQ